MYYGRHYDSRYNNLFESIEQRINILNNRTAYNNKLQIALARQDEAYKRFNKSYIDMWPKH